MQKKLSIILTIILFGAILVFADSNGFLDGAKKTVNTAVTPIGTFLSESSSGITGFFSNIFNIGKLQEENATLTDELNQLKAEVARLQEVKEENKNLRLDLGFAEKTGFDYVPVQVTAYDPSNIRGMVTINKGRGEGITEGMAAVSEGFLIGRVYEASDNYAKIMLVTDPMSAIPVAVSGSTTNGIAKGELGSGLKVEKIPQGDKIEAGDTIITSGLGGEIPRGIVIGKVESVDAKENSLFVTANIRPEANLKNILRTLIIKN